MRRGEPVCSPNIARSPCINDGSSRIYRLSITKGKHIGLPLPEYRSILINNAVTGKIDVRDFKLPTEPAHA
jgi:hypothetical protein